MSTLHVENLKGLSSGGNANKIIVPSGQTLDASAGVLTPSSGQVVQCVSRDDARGHISTTSTSYVSSGVACSITPKFADSIIVMDFHFPMTHTPNSNGQLVPRLYRGSTALSSVNYSQGYHTSDGEYQNITVQGRDAGHNSTSSLTYEVYFRTSSGGQAFLCHNSSETHIKLWEIKA